MKLLRLDCTGEWLHWMSGIPQGNNLRSRLPGMLARNVCVHRWGMLRTSGDNPTSLRLTVGLLCSGRVSLTCWRYCAFSGLTGDQLLGRELLNLVLLCREWRYLGHILQPNLPCTWRTEQLHSSDNSYCPSFCGRRRPMRCLITVDGQIFFW